MAISPPSNSPKNPKTTPNRKFDAPIESEIYKDESPSPFSIEGIRSGAVQSKLFKGFILLSGLVMAGGLIISSLNPTGQAPSNAPPAQRAPTNETVATVAGRAISDTQLESSFAQQVQAGEQFGQRVGVMDYLPAKQRALQGLADNTSTILAAQASGMTVSDAEVDADIDKKIDEALKPQPGQTEAAFRRLVEAKEGSMQGARDKMKESVTPEFRDQTRDRLLVEKLEKQVKDANKVTEDDYKRANTKLHLLQIVARPDLPAPNAKDLKLEMAAKARAAETKITGIATALKAAPTLANFKATAIKSSDDLATKAKGGDLGFKLPTELFYGPDISAAVAKSKTDLVGPLKDASGNQYLFFIAARQLALPKDYAKNKKKLLADFETQEDQTAWGKLQESYKKIPEVSDNALSAFQIQTVNLSSAAGDAQKKLREDAISRYNDALSGTGGVEAAAINYQLAGLYRDENDHQKQLDALSSAVKAVPSDANLRLEYARALRTGGKPKDALEQLKAASTALGANPSPPSPFGGGNPDDAVRQQIAGEYDQLKEPKLAAAERAKIKPSPQGGMGGAGGLPPGMSIVPPK